MGYKIETNKEKIEQQYKYFLKYKTVDESKLDDNYLRIRKYMNNKFNEYKIKGYVKYKLDLYLALDLYEFLNKEKDFAPLFESNYDFWKYLAVYVIPEIVENRYGAGIEEKYIEHYYKKSVRIYPYALYWYIHLSWQGDKEKTLQVLSDFSTDEILQLVERPSKIGINLELYRKIMLKYSHVPKKSRIITKNNKKISLFRLILIYNTSKLTILKPELYPGGVEAYVNMLYYDNLKE